MKNRVSIITILLLVLVIIGLSVALVVTNINYKKLINEKQCEITSNEENNDDTQASVDETPTYVSLDNEIVKDMYQILNSGPSVDLFHYFKKGVLTIEDFTDEDIQTIAFYRVKANQEELDDSEKVGIRGRKLQTKYMDEAVKKIFGDIEYEHTYALYQDIEIDGIFPKLAEYDKSSDVYYINTGFGGGSDTYAETAITKVEEYSDKYIVTEKLILTVNDSGFFTLYPFYGRNIRFDNIIERIPHSDIDNLTNTKNVYSYNDITNSTNDLATKLISKYYDYCTEYKHTFMKNEDGSYYWVKSEIVK